MNGNHYAVIMAGGVGSRFWPISRRKFPKQFLDFLENGKSLFQATYERFTRICPKENIYVVANQDYEEIIKKQVPGINDDQLLLEPLAKNTAPCIAYSVFKIMAKNQEATIVVAPSDHLIFNENSFRDCVLKTMHFASSKDALVTLGIKPSRPDTGYGYIRMTDRITEDGFIKVRKFHEKPLLYMALRFFKSGNYLWNAGIFIASGSTFKKAFSQYLPEMSDCFNSTEEIYYTPKEKDFILKAFNNCDKIPFDRGIMEKADNTYVLPANFGWSDIGTWKSAYELWLKDENRNAVKGKNVYVRNTKNCIIKVSDDKLLAVNSVDNLIIVESDNIILIADKSKEQEITKVVEEIKVWFGEGYI